MASDQSQWKSLIARALKGTDGSSVSLSTMVLVKFCNMNHIYGFIRQAVHAGSGQVPSQRTLLANVFILLLSDVLINNAFEHDS